MKREEIEQKIQELQDSEYLSSEDADKVMKEVDNFIKLLNDYFGYNDGEPLDEDGINFIIEYLLNKWKLVNNIYE